MTALADLVDHVIGVDPDRDRINAAVVCAKTQGEIDCRVFPATARGYGQALRWAAARTADGRRAWAIESTGSYGAGLAASLSAKDEFVIGFDHPSTERRRGREVRLAGRGACRARDPWSQDVGDPACSRDQGRTSHAHHRP